MDYCKHAQNGVTALMLAARFGHVDCAQLLLQAGADKNAKTQVCFGLYFRSELEISEMAVLLCYPNLGQ